MPLLAPIILILGFWRGLRHDARDPRFRAAVTWMLFLLGIGMVHYHMVEGWSWTDSLYFCVVTLATVGYGDLAPTTTGSKMFTVLYVIMGMSVWLTFVTILAKSRADANLARAQTANVANAEGGES